MNITSELLKSTINKLGYKWYSDRPNLIGIRTTLDVPDAFNDLFTLTYTVPLMPAGLGLKAQQIWLNKWAFKGANGLPLDEDGKPGSNTSFALQQYESSKGKELTKIYANTTNPGVYWMNNPISGLGAAVLKPGQWVNCWSLGFHHSKPDHRALVQTGKITVYRDNNKDNKYQVNEAATETGLFGINIHGSGKLSPSTVIGKWSAGCQVFSNWNNKEEVMNICDNYKDLTANKFTYTLMNEVDLV